MVYYEDKNTLTINLSLWMKKELRWDEKEKKMDKRVLEGC